ncbi:DUF4190 domain-containing protein [Miltoncostaea marina]|uniref:DUF4190 domain-containing protein n=1 Tax=Miltoncostaea marina TaxID=2843215 RepID=UPI001C3C4112|nr:DUF4190 domain-containing protein [Miltoncostaea marina]
MADDPLRRAILLVRAGLATGALAGVLVALAPVADIVSGPADEPHGALATAGAGASVAVIAALGAAGAAAGAALRLLWVHLVGLVLATGLALMAAFLVIGARTSDRFADDADLALEGGGLLLVAGFWMALAGVAMSLVGIRKVAQSSPEVRLAPGRLQRARTAPLAAILGIVAVVAVVTSALAVAYGVLALGDIRSSGERLAGRGQALTGLVLGILVLSLLAAVGGVGMLTASPGGL